MKVAALTRVGNDGWEGYGFEISGCLKNPCPVSLTLYTEEGQRPWAYQSLYQNEDTIRVIFPKFSYFQDYILIVDENLISKEKVDEVRTLWADLFEDCRTSDFWYRLYSPKEKEPRPLILFLHGGGECGTDNWKQMVNTVGAARLAERYPDVYVMAPQTPVDLRKQVEEADGPRAYATAQMYGWTKSFLKPVCDEIRR
ncbi:MAG: hypothetical protein LUH19_07300, partial [Lachnospiraceae bacterium]|nr:hypothetical protein [Lachnospiraceae bacterium]